MSEKYGASYVSGCVEESEKARHTLEGYWMINDLWSEGIHTPYIDAETKTIKTFKPKTYRMRQIDLFNPIRNGLTNAIVKNAPRPEARKSNSQSVKGEKTLKQLHAVNTFLSTFYEEKNLQTITRDVVKDGFDKNQGWVSVWYTDPTGDGVGDITIMKENSWSILPDPKGKIDHVTGEFDGEYIIKRVVVDKNRIETNPSYDAVNRNKLRPFTDKSASRVENEIIRATESNSNKPVDNYNCLITEFYYRKWVIERDEETGKEYQALKYYRKIFNQDLLLQDETPLDVNMFPFICFQAKRKDGNLFPVPWMSRIIDLNKMIDMLLTKLDTQARRMGQGIVLKHEQTKLDTITGEDGQILEWSGMRPPEQMQTQGISSELLGFYNTLYSLLQDVGMFHLESLGGGGNQSGVAIAQKQAGDIFNVQEPAENLAIFMGALFKYILRLANDRYVSTRFIYDEKGEELKIIGDSAKSTPKDSIKLTDVDRVKVKIVPAGVYSDVEKEQKLIQMMNLGVIDPKTFVEEFATGEAGRIMERLEIAKLESQGRNAAAEKAIKQADKDIASLVQGKSIPVPQFDDEQAKNAYMNQFVKKLDGQQFENEQLMVDHIEKFIQQNGIIAGQDPQNPQGQVEATTQPASPEEVQAQQLAKAQQKRAEV